jgi:tetratricopeptide (TPR) repeat protein
MALGVVTLLAYSNSFTAGFTLDNRVVLTQDPRIRAWTAQNLRLIFTQNYWWPYAASDLYRPLTTLSYLFNHAVLGNGDRPAGYHWVNFFLHWANAWMVLALLHRLTGRLRLSLLAAAIFAVHPVNVESVTNIVGRADLLATFSILVGGWCYLRAAAAGGWRKLPWLAGVVITTCLGVLAKENAVMISAFVLLYDWLWRWPKLPGTNGWERLRAAGRGFVLQGWMALLPAALLLLWARHRLLYITPVYGQFFVDNPIAFAGRFQGVMTALGVMGRYLGLLVLPYTLSCDYSYNEIPLFGEGAHWWLGLYAWISLAVVAGLVWAAVRGWRRHAVFTWGALFFFLMLLPTSNLLVPIGSIMAERFLYLPSIGFCLVAALALRPMGAALARAMVTEPRWLVPAARVLPSLAVAVLALRTHVRNADWQDNLSLWRSAVAAAPDSFKVHKGLANALWDAGHDEPAADAAIARAELGLAVLDQKPLAPERRDNTLFYDLGMYYRRKGDLLTQRAQPGEAERFYRQAVAILLRAREVDQYADEAAHRAALSRGHQPGDLQDVGNFRIHLELGLAYLRLGNWAEAEAACRYAQRLAPGEADTYLFVGAARFYAGRYDAGAVQILAALILQPVNSDGWANLQKCYEALGLVPVPIVTKGSNHLLDDKNPIVHRQLGEACAELYRNFQAARLPDSAQALRAMALKQYRVPESIFTAPP